VKTRAAAAAVALLACSAMAAGEDSVGIAPLHVIATENPTELVLAADAPARVKLLGPDLQGLAKVLGVPLAASQASFEYVIDRYPQVQTSTPRTWLESTFVVDYTEPEFEPLRVELAARPAKPTRAQLVEYVSGLLEASDDRDWDLASVVARRRKGDCSEHAVLTAALARQQGIPARVAIGVALVSQDKRHGAFGHAWAEMLEDGQWKVADAALHGVDTVRYLPIGVMEDEGLGYTMEIVRIMHTWIDRVVVLGPR
jgi:hypothetical protein